MSQKKRKNISQRPHTRKIALPLLCWALLALVPCGASPVHAGEVINYMGGALATAPGTDKANSLFPTGSASSNTVIAGANVPGDVYGGISTGFDDASNNAVTIKSNSEIGGNVYGGYASQQGNASNNSVTIEENATVKANIYGGYQDFFRREAHDNKVVINGTVEGKVYGGFIGVNGTASGNSVTIGRTGHVKGDLYGGQTSSTPVENNSIDVLGKVDGNIYGGATATKGTATGNRIVLHKGSVVNGNLYGGFADIQTATHNTIDIAGTFTGEAYGGYSGSFSAEYNTIILRAGADVSGAKLFGGGLKTIRTGNTLWLDGFTGKVQEIGNFENYYFLLPETVKANDTILTVTGGAQTDMQNSTIGIGLKGGGFVLNKGDTITLIHNDKGVDFTDSTIDNDIPDYINGRQGISLDYRFSLVFNEDKTSLEVKVTDVQDSGDGGSGGSGGDGGDSGSGGDDDGGDSGGESGGNTGGNGQAVRVNPQVASLLEGRVAALSLINQGADLLTASGMEKARAAARNTAPEAPWATFAALSSATSRIDSGSDVTLNSLNLLAGFARSFDFSAGDFLLAVFGEAGFGSYWSKSDFQGLRDISGKGYTNYLGAGLAGRLELLSGPYVEASFRAGQSYFNFATDDLRDAYGVSADYDLRVPYYGAHAGLGYIWNLGDSVQIDVYGKYFWTHLGSGDAHVAGDPFSFDAADSRRLRTGTRVTYTPTPAVSLFAGAAYEHEFSGKLTGTTYGFDIPDAPSLRGDTGRGELGVIFRPGQGALAVELGLQGATGISDSIGGMLQISYTF